MPKVLIARDLKPLLTKDESLMNRKDIAVITADTNDDLLTLHVENVADLIISRPDLPGARIESVFGIIRKSDRLKRVGVIMICERSAFDQERCRRSGANLILTAPVDRALLMEKTVQLLNVAPRKDYRVVLNVTAQGKYQNRTFLCRTENISASGLLIRAALGLAPGDQVSCSFYLPDSTKVSAHGAVMRAAKHPDDGKETHYGICYTFIEAKIRDKIEAYVNRERVLRAEQAADLRPPAS